MQSPSDKGILDGGCQGVAEMQLAGDVRRRQNDRKHFARFSPRRGEVALLLPPVVPTGFDRGRVVAIRKWWAYIWNEMKNTVVDWKTNSIWWHQNGALVWMSPNETVIQITKTVIKKPSYIIFFRLRGLLVVLVLDKIFKWQDTASLRTTGGTAT